jgi:flagellar biosynthesis/type III secretory pathway ATPase
VLSEPDGAFRVQHLPKGTFTIFAIYPGLPEADAFRVPVATRGVRVQFAKGAALAGRVVDGRGAPIETYTLYTMLSRDNVATAELKAAQGYVQQTETVQNKAGTFEVSELHAAIYDLLVTTPAGQGGRLGGITLAPGETRRDLEVKVGDGVRVKGRVVDADGQPLSGVTVVGWLAMLKEQVKARSDTSGAFVLEGVIPGPLDLSLRGAPQSGQVGNKTIIVPDKPELDAGTFTLTRR